MTYRRRYVETMVGLLVLVAAGLIAAAAVAIHRARSPWGETVRLRAELPAAQGLQPGAGVTVAGLKVGEVSAVGLSDRMLVAVELRVRREVAARLKSDTRVSLSPLGLLGLPGGLELLPGQGPEALAEDALLPTEEKGGVQDVLTRLRPVLDEIPGMARSLGALAGRLGDERGDLQSLLRRLNEVAGGLAAGRGTVGKLVREEDFYQEARALLGRLDQAAARADKALEELQALLGELRQVSPRLPGLVGQGERLLAGGGRLLRAARGLPLVGGLAAPPAPGAPLAADAAGD